MSEDSGRCSRRPHSVISVSSSSSSGGSSGPPTTLNLGLDTSPRPHHRSTTLNSQCSVGMYIIVLSFFFKNRTIIIFVSLQMIYRCNYREWHNSWYFDRLGWWWRWNWKKSLELYSGKSHLPFANDIDTSSITDQRNRDSNSYLGFFVRHESYTIWSRHVY